MDEGGGFDAERGGEVFEGGLEAFGGPGFEAGQAVAEDVEAFEGSVGAEGFFDTGFVVGVIVVEEKFDPGGDVGEVFDFFFDQRERGEEGLAGAVVDAGLVDEGEAQVGKAFEGHLDEVLAVHPKTFVEVEAGAAAVDIFQLEDVDDFFDGEDFAVVLRRPTEEAEVVAHGFRGVALFDVALHAGAGVALAHLGAVRIEDEREVGELGRLDAEGLVEFDVLGGIRKVVFAADDMGHFHLDVVDHVDEVKNPRAVRAADGHVGMGAGVGEVERDRAADFVMHGDGFPGRAEAQGAGVFVDHAFVLQNLEVALVDGAAFALVIGAVVATLFGALVPVESQPAKAFINGADRFFVVAFAVGVLDAQDKGSAGVPGMEPVEEGGAGAADVEEAGGGRSETDADG